MHDSAGRLGRDGQASLEELPDPTPGPRRSAESSPSCSINTVTSRWPRAVFRRRAEAPAIPLSDAPARSRGRGGSSAQGRRPRAVVVLPGLGGRPAARGPGARRRLRAGHARELVCCPSRGADGRSLELRAAACLACAGVTAWNALYEGPRALVPGNRCWCSARRLVDLALHSPRRGCEVIATSSSDDNWRAFARSRRATVNYRPRPNGAASSAASWAASTGR